LITINSIKQVSILEILDVLNQMKVHISYDLQKNTVWVLYRHPMMQLTKMLSHILFLNLFIEVLSYMSRKSW